MIEIIFHLLSYRCILWYRYFGPNSEWCKSSSLISKVLL